MHTIAKIASYAISLMAAAYQQTFQDKIIEESQIKSGYLSQIEREMTPSERYQNIKKTLEDELLR